jgi:spermidine synthase
MAQPWKTIDIVKTADGDLELRQRGEHDFLILINGRVLMNSSANRSEIVLGEQASAIVVNQERPRVLIGGLGMGLTLRAALNALPVTAQVVVAELNPITAAWCRDPLADLNGHAVDDLRVTVVIDDVARVIAKAGQTGAEKFGAIIIDLYEGPHAKTDARNDPFYGSIALHKTADALSTGGIFAIWGENPDVGFEKRLEGAGFSFERLRPGRGGMRHVVYVAKRKS